MNKSFLSHDLKEIKKKKKAFPRPSLQVALLTQGSTVTCLCLNVNWGLDEGNWGPTKELWRKFESTE